MLLCVPNRENPEILEDVVMLPKMYDIFKEYMGWNKIMKLNNVGEFNVACKNNQSFNLIKVSEALHEKKVALIADMIEKRAEKVRFVLISGPSSSGKTTLVQHMIAEAQKQGGTAALIDAEHAFDPSYAEKTGVNVDDLLVSQPDTGEQALEIADTLIRSNAGT
jgi:ABC-type ATPase with predicted acetyltransferase domain